MTAPASSMACKLCTTLYFSTASLTRARRRIPAVSISTNASPSRSQGTRMLSRVVPGSSDVIKRFAPISRLISVDLPTLGRPITATRGPSRACAGLARIARVAERLEQALEQLVDALTVQRGDSYRLSEPERMELRCRDLAEDTFGLVDGDHDRFCRAPQHFGDLAILGREPGLVIHDEHDGVCLIDGKPDLLRNERDDSGLASNETARIDHEKRPIFELADAVPAIAREAWVVGDERVARARQPIE